uniref:Receptor-like serine/threonine-protein kinase n=1 Tax=Arabidopsis kamchatica subsp. kamchatica TaxID=1219863 RepID=I7FNZ6_9BRAS|nr:SRK [Arabidopsis kamchatica subsp. kamchatica]
MRGEVPNKHHSYIFFVFLFFVLVLFPAFSISANTLSATESLTISSNKTIVSPGGVFELGFFKLLGDSWYIGIWYKKIPQRTYVWVANRDNPLSNSIGILKLSNANLVLLNQSNIPVWSTTQTGAVRSLVVAELLDNGNFVLKDSRTNDSDGFLWQSFDFPTDTLLPQMKLGRDLKRGLNKSLSSWKSSFDPSSGDYVFKLEPQGIPEFFTWKRRNFRLFRSGPWDGIGFSGIPDMHLLDDLMYNFTENREEVAYSFRLTNHSVYSRLTINSDGLLQRFEWVPEDQEWTIFWSTLKDSCDIYNSCGPYAYCDVSTSPACNCIEGFQPPYPQEWALGDVTGRCQRKTKLSCIGDKFIRLRNMKLPPTTEVIVDKRIGFKDCEERCTSNCNCLAFAITDIRNGGSGCVIWIEEFVDIRNYAAGGQDLYVRLAAADIGGTRTRNVSGKIIGLIVGFSVMLLVTFIMYCFWQRKQRRARAIAAHNETEHRQRIQEFLTNGVVISSRRHNFGENETEEIELPFMEFGAVVMATDNFSDSNKLGEGGFGLVYKGRLPDGKEIAVKRLSAVSHQGTDEFMNEARLIARLQHINLVRLLGCYADATEKMLIYEYLENLSLDFHLFYKTQSYKLDWKKRFDIINGITRGLLYLHQDSRFKIIHRDLKASNILLDEYMTPKISDFGMARIFERNETEANTRKVVGTYGYMSPEYAMDGIFSEKSDVFSFGVLVLEIVSGKRNRGFYNSNHDSNLLSYTWENWKDGIGLQIADPIIIDCPSSSFSTFKPQEVLRCIQIGLLCVQERAEDRPKMSSVALMLGSQTEAIPQPKPPGYCVGRSFIEADLSSSTQLDHGSSTVNQITVSAMKAR